MWSSYSSTAMKNQRKRSKQFLKTQYFLICIFLGAIPFSKVTPGGGQYLKVICNAGVGGIKKIKMWEEGVAQGVSKCNIEFKMRR